VHHDRHSIIAVMVQNKWARCCAIKWPSICSSDDVWDKFLQVSDKVRHKNENCYYLWYLLHFLFCTPCSLLCCLWCHKIGPCVIFRWPHEIKVIFGFFVTDINKIMSGVYWRLCVGVVVWLFWSAVNCSLLVSENVSSQWSGRAV